ncbi:DNA-binding response regulator [Rubrivirga sp. SAORIC476]|uniref:response regulator transcription factor n=1 Tax=Rubrivirga sp. SAORIC476 TaxID=1961794 RepID=UPI000BA9B32D|nr:response regulator transcription factor [Rubrivirga sp. SAORIC476]PAP81483.1 DNA-binding response regulator [Rubrivirga sp. SAORIC476]
MRVLVVEDDPHIADFVTTGLREAGYAVDHAADGEAAYALSVNEPYDAAVVDLMLPRLDGLGLIERMRGSGVATPVLILSAKRTVDDRVTGLQAGGDDYLTKPFAFAELLARVQALVRRSTGTAEPTRLVAGPVALDLLAHQATRAGETLDLQPREFALLELLVRNAGRVVSKTAIHQSVWDFDFNPTTNVVEVLIHRLRQKLDEPFEPALVHTVRGAGYVLRTP